MRHLSCKAPLYIYKVWQGNLERFIAGKEKKIRLLNGVKYGQGAKGGLGIPHLYKYYEALQINYYIYTDRRNSRNP